MNLRRFFVIITLLLISVSAYVADADNSHRDVLSVSTPKEVRQWEVTGPWGGDVRAMVVSPADSNLVYLGTSDGQIYRSTDGTATWRRLKPGLGRRGLTVDSLAIDPRNPRIIYAGVWPVSTAEEGGVYKSDDGGESWKMLESTKKMSVRSFAIAPSDSNFLTLGTANDNSQLNGVFRSTDGGKNWERISPVGDKEIRNIESVAIDPRDTNIIYAGTWHLPWKTINGGATWKQCGNEKMGMINDSDIFGITVDLANPNVVYMNACSGFYRSTNAGEKWYKFPGIPFSARRTYVLTPHPTNPNVIFAGTSEGLWRTKDGGKRWMLLTSKTFVIRSILVTPDKPDRVMIATDDFGVRVSENLGDSFRDSNIGFIHRHVLSIMADASERGRLLASVFHDGSAGSVFVSTNGGETWDPSSRGLGTRDAFAFYQMPDNPNVIYAGTNYGVYRSNDRGSSWSFVGMEKPQPVKKPAKRPARRPARKRASLTLPADMQPETLIGQYQLVPASMSSLAPAAQKKKTTKKPAQKRPVKPKAAPEPVAPAGPPMFELTQQVDDITSFVDNEGRRGLMAATMTGLYKTYDDSKGWEKVYIHGYDFNGRVFSVSNHKETPKRIYVGTRQGLYVSDDGGAMWQKIERGPNDMSIKSIAQDPRDPQLVILGTNQHIFRSTNAGRTWVRRGGGLPAGDYTSVVINPTNPDEVVVAEYSRGGVYRSIDKGYSWERIDLMPEGELPTNRVWTLVFDPFDRDRIYAGSFSSGVYVLTIQRGASSSTQ